MKFKIRYGLGGGFGGCGDWEEVEERSLEDAMLCAEQAAREVYESYEGMNGIRSVEDIKEEEDCNDEIAEEIYADEVDSWLAYEAKPIDAEE